MHCLSSLSDLHKFTPELKKMKLPLLDFIQTERKNKLSASSLSLLRQFYVYSKDSQYLEKLKTSFIRSLYFVSCSYQEVLLHFSHSEIHPSNT
jgi:hypothetical protein